MAKNKIKKESITTIGVVIPVEWDINGKPSAYAFSTYEENEYLIDIRTDLGKEISAIEKQKISVTGTLGRMVKNRRVISITRYEKLFSSDEYRAPETIKTS